MGKTKGTNTFRFKSFSERIEEIDIRSSALYHIGHENEELLEEDETFFHQTLRKWTVLNLTTEYTKFSRTCGDIVTLPQLLHKKEFVINLLLEKIKTPNVLSLQPFLELLVAAGKDLREEFYPEFSRVLEVLLKLLESEDSDILEWTFICLAFLVKSLKPFLKRNIHLILKGSLSILCSVNNKVAGNENNINFAVECFAFVARDIKNSDALITFIENDTEILGQSGLDASGRLLFEIVRGVNGNFHSCAESFLQILFERFLNGKNVHRRDYFYEVINKMINDLLSIIHPHNMGVFWVTITQVINKTLATNDDFDREGIEQLIHLMLIAGNYKNGKYIMELDKITGTINNVVEAVSTSHKCDSLFSTISNLSSSILMSESAKISQLQTSCLIKRFLNVSNRRIFEEFVWNIRDHSQFELLVLNGLVGYYENNLDKSSLELLSKIILKKTTDNWVKYPLVLRKSGTLAALRDKILNFKNVAGPLCYELEEYLLITVLLPHLPSADEKLIQKMKQDIEMICQFLEDSNDANEKEIQFLLFRLLIFIESLSRSIDIDEYLQKRVIDAALPFCVTYSIHCLIGLKILHLMGEMFAKRNETTMDSPVEFLKLEMTICENLSSPNQKIRHLTTRVLKEFAVDPVRAKVYELFYNIESISPTVHTYREQLLYLQKLHPDGDLIKNAGDDKIKENCIRLCCGLLYVNFKLTWDPVSNLLCDLASQMDVNNFWSIFKSKLEHTANHVVDSATVEIRNDLEFSCACLQDIYEGERRIAEKVIDHHNYRNLLWSIIPKLGTISEIKNRDIVSMVLDFVQKEYGKFREKNDLTWDLTTTAAQKINEDGELTRGPKDNSEIPFKKVFSTLMIKMKVFTTMANPKQLYREKELYDFYMECLTSTNLHLQKISLDCLLAYKNKSLIPYKEHLYAIIEETNLKNELVNFKLDKEDGSIQMEHRKDVMEVLLRILYGKILTKTTAKDSQHSSKREIIVRFLAGADKEEIYQFLKMSFSVYSSILDKYDFIEIPKIVRANFNSRKVWSPRILQSTLNLLQLMEKHFAWLLEGEMVNYLIKLIIFVVTICNRVIEEFSQNTSVHNLNTKMQNVYKSLRSSAILHLTSFYDHLLGIEMSPKEIDIMFECIVWPQIDRLPQESIHSPTPLLKLFFTWSQNPSFFSLLDYKNVNEKNKTPFDVTIELLLNEKCKPMVKRGIMEMIERLLKPSTGNLTETDTKETLSKSSLPDGLFIVKPYILQILSYLQKKLRRKCSKKRQQNIEKQDLTVLSYITSLAGDDSLGLCDSLLKLLIPITISKAQNSSEDVSTKMLTTIGNLLKQQLDNENLQKYINLLAPMFEHFPNFTERKLLCEFIKIVDNKLKTNNQETSNISRIIFELNAWDKRWVEQPDYDKRLATISSLKKQLNEDNITLELGFLITYNCFHVIKFEKDIGLRDNTIEFLHILLPKLIKDYEKIRPNEIQKFIEEVLFNFIKRTIRSKNDQVYTGGIKLLGELARKCPESHPILADLNLLADEIDEEVDFFENITHLQLYRHGKALLRFCNVFKTVTELPNSKTLLQFILPLSTKYLLNEKYAQKHTLVDAAIDAISVVCKLLPWSHYQMVLRYYLQRLRYSHDYQKQLVRMVVAILDAFHFDLRNYSETYSEELKINKQKNEKKVVKMEEDKIEAEVKEEETTDVKSENEEASDLDEFLNENEIEDEENKEVMSTNILTDCMIILSPAAAKNVVHIIRTVLLPTLDNSIIKASTFDNKHKLNRRRFDKEREEEEILRVPIALAMVKLLQKLPTKFFEDNLPGIFMKVCTFLKSPLKSVRMLTRDILKKIMLSIGSKYLPVLLDQMISLLTKGFQVHVLSVTVHGVLDCLKEEFQPGEIDSCLQNLLEVCLNDIFGEVAEEKEIEKIAAHTPEAKPSVKSFIVLYIVAKNIKEGCLVDIIRPLHEYLKRTSSKKIITKVQNCFQKIVKGLLENTLIPAENLVTLIYGILSKSIPRMFHQNTGKKLTEKELKMKVQRNPDCFLIPKEPKFRSGAVRNPIKMNTEANNHVLFEFALELLHTILKRNKLASSDLSAAYLNPLIPLILEGLKSSSVRVVTLAMKNFTSFWTGECDLENLRNSVEEITDQIFVLLHKYTSFDTTRKGDNFLLVRSAYKTIVAILRNCDYYKISSEHITKLIFYIEHDIQESNRQPAGFSMLKAIISKGIETPEIHEIMRKLCDMAIISESDSVRNEARTILMIYLIEYPLQKKVIGIIKFFTVQLNYSMPNGRLSAMEMLYSIIQKFPKEKLTKNAELLYLSLGPRLVNDEFPECRMKAAECIEHLIQRLKNNQGDLQKIYELNLLFLEGNKPAVREMAATLILRFLAVEKDEFSPRVKLTLPVLVDKLTANDPKKPGRFVKNFPHSHGVNDDDAEEGNYIPSINKDIDENKTSLLEQQKQRAVDHEIIQIGNCIVKMLEICPGTLKDTNLEPTIDELAYGSQRLLAYGHEWIRVNSAKILYHILGSYDPEVVSKLLKEKNQKTNEKSFIYFNPVEDIRSLTLDFCAQMIPGETSEKIAEEVFKNLLYIGNFLKDIPTSNKRNTEENEESDDADEMKVNLRWLLRRIRYVSHGEVAKAPHSTMLRSTIFNYLQGLINLLNKDILEKISEDFLAILIREMIAEDDQNVDKQLRQKAINIGNIIKRKIGEEQYNKIRTQLQTRLMAKRAERKKVLKMEKINDPVRAAKRKQSMQERRKAAKKRKIDVIRGKAIGKKRKRKLEEDEELF